MPGPSCTEKPWISYVLPVSFFSIISPRNTNSFCFYMAIHALEILVIFQTTKALSATPGIFPLPA
jgi:hypothetical protein